jgi:hypothetical protein
VIPFQSHGQIELFDAEFSKHAGPKQQARAASNNRIGAPSAMDAALNLAELEE